MKGERLKIAGVAKAVLTDSDGRVKEIIFSSNNATATVKVHTVQRIIQNLGLTQAGAIHLYNATTAPASGDIIRFAVVTLGTGSITSTTGSTATGAVSGQVTITANNTVQAIALHTAASTIAADGSAGYALVTASIVLASNDIFGVTWCLTVQ